MLIHQRKTIHVLLLAAFLAACGGVSDSVPEGNFVAPVVAFKLVFEDNFDGSALDTTKWNIDAGDGCPELCGWGNNETQIYAAANIDVSGGTLKIEGRQEAGGEITSARINTKGKFDFTYGRVEVSARLPAGQGAWPAVWLLHSDPTIYGPWPLSGEIDIMEAFNPGVGGNNSIQSTTHYGLPTEPFNGTTSTYDVGSPLDADFHEYAIEWERDKMRFFVDGVHIQAQNSDNWYAYFPADEAGFYEPLGAYKVGPRDAPFDQAFHLLINFALGGNPVGALDTSILPQVFEIDYVRVYECENSNPDTKRGCGTGDVNVTPLEDNDGSPLQAVETAQPYTESLDLYIDAPETITVNVGSASASNTLSVGGFVGQNATVTNDPSVADPDDATNTVWHVSVAGDVANAFLSSEDLSADAILDSGFDFSGNRTVATGGDPVGELVFDMKINSIDATTQLLVKLDSGFPNVGEVVLPAASLAAVGEWKTYSVKFSDLVANPGFVGCCGGQGVDLSNVVNPFVFEVQAGAADVYLDNIRVTNACKVVGACGADLRTKGIPDVVVFDDAVNVSTWNLGINGSDSGSGFSNYSDGTNPANKANWREITDTDPSRGEVIEVTFNDSAAFGVWFIESSGAVDLSAYSAGAVEFDIKVLDYGSNTNGMTMKIDCFFPCTSGDKALGVIADGVWERVVMPVSQLTGSGLDLANVTTGVVVFPTSQSGEIKFLLDDIRWVAETAAPPLSQIDLPVTFDDSSVDYTLIDFGGASSVTVTDPADSNNTVAQTTKPSGAQTFAGTVMGTGSGFATPIPFAPGDTSMSVRVYSPAAGIPVLLKVENSDASVAAEVLINTTAANAWETLTFDFASVGIDTSVSFVQAIIFFDFNQPGNDAVYLWDDVQFGVGAPPAPPKIDLPLTFDDSSLNYGFIDFNGTATALGADPDNGANMVAITTKGNGAATFAGTVMGDGTGFENPIPFAPGATGMSVRVRTPAAGIPVLLKVENADASVAAEVTAMTTVADQWETLTFDFSTVGIDTTVDFVQAIVFFDFGQMGTGATYYWDDVAHLPPQLAQIDLPVNFDQSGIDYTLIDFSGTSTVLGSDPANAANTVAITTKGNGAATFAGTVMGTGAGFATPIPFAAGATTMAVRVYSPTANTPVLLKVENSDQSVFAEVMVNTTMSNAWETLVFDFSTVGINLSATYVQAVIFFDFGNPGNDAVYYWDDVVFGDGSGTQMVFGDAVDAVWDIGIGGADDGSGFALYTDGTNPANKSNWSIVDAVDMSRGKVIDVVFNDSMAFGVWFIQSTGAVDLSAYANGSLVFDIRVLDYGTNTTGMTMKVDCIFPCTSGDQPIGVVGDNAMWETVTIPVSQLVGGGLNLMTVNTGLVIFPNFGEQEGGINFRLDNIRWEQ